MERKEVTKEELLVRTVLNRLKGTHYVKSSSYKENLSDSAIIAQYNRKNYIALTDELYHKIESDQL